MHPSQTSSPPPTVSECPVIPPSQVWVNLTQGQQQCLLQTIVLICQELVAAASPLQESEVSHD